MGCGPSTPNAPLEASSAEKVDIGQATVPSPASDAVHQEVAAAVVPGDGHAPSENGISIANGVKHQNPGFFDLRSGQRPQLSSREAEAIKASLAREGDLEVDVSTTSDGASHGSHINTFDSLSHFEHAGLSTSNNRATTFQRPKEAAAAAAGPPAQNSRRAAAPGRLPQESSGKARRKKLREERPQPGGRPPTPPGRPRSPIRSRPGAKPDGGKTGTRSPPRQAREFQEDGSSAAEAKPRGRKKSWSSVQLSRSGDESSLPQKGGKRVSEHPRRRRPTPQRPARQRAAPEEEDDDEDELSGAEGSWRQPAARRPGAHAEGRPQRRHSHRQQTGPAPRQGAQEGPAAGTPRAGKSPGRLSRRPPSHAAMSQQAAAAAGQAQKHRARTPPPARGPQPAGGRGENPFAELVDTQASSLDQLLTTASLNKPTLTTVIGNPLASNGSLTEEEAREIEDMFQFGGMAADGGSPAPGNSNVGGWPRAEHQQAASAQPWRSIGQAAAQGTPSAAIMASDAASDAATAGSLLNTAAEAPVERQPSASLRHWHAAGASAPNSSTNRTSLLGSSRGTPSADSGSEGGEAPPASLNIGEIRLSLDRYDNLGPLSDVTTHSIAQGAMRLLRRRQDGRLFAGKFIPRPQGAVLHKWHEREIINHRAVHGHPHVIGFRDLFMTDVHVVLVTDYASRGALAALLRARRTLPEPEAQRLFRQLVAALGHCHARGVCHRNLQLECILLDGDEGAPILKLGGFSRSKSGDADSQPKSTVGRPAYTAPELLQGTFQNGDLAAYSGPGLDVWACGLVLFHMLCGYNPFQGPGKKREGFTTQMMRRICSAEYSFPEAPALSADCRDLIRRILVADPEERITLPGVLQHPWVGPPPQTPAGGGRNRQSSQATEAKDVERVATHARVEEEVLEAVARSRRRRSTTRLDRLSVEG